MSYLFILKNVIWDTGIYQATGTVFYPWENDIDGGYLEIYPDGQDGEPERLEPK